MAINRKDQIALRNILAFITGMFFIMLFYTINMYTAIAEVGLFILYMKFTLDADVLIPKE